MDSIKVILIYTEGSDTVFKYREVQDGRKDVERHSRQFYIDKPCAGALRQSVMAMVHGVRRCESSPVGLHQLVPDDVDPAETGSKIIDEDTVGRRISEVSGHKGCACKK